MSVQVEPTIAACQQSPDRGEGLARVEPWGEQRLRLTEERICVRLGRLAAHLGDAASLDGAFSAGDLMMVSVLLRLRASSDVLGEYPIRTDPVARGGAQPSYKRAFAAQLAVFTAAATRADSIGKGDEP